MLSYKVYLCKGKDSFCSHIIVETNKDETSRFSSHVLVRVGNFRLPNFPIKVAEWISLVSSAVISNMRKLK